MKQFFSVLAFLVTRQTQTSTSFWNDLSRVSQLHDPPPPDILKQIQERPWKGGLEPISPEGIDLHDAELVEGKIPEDLEGMLFRNGPGRIRIGNKKYGHWFDGDGLVTRLCISGKSQKATFTAKYVKTTRFQAQQRAESKDPNCGFAKAGAWTKRGNGRRFENLFAIPTNPSNTNVIWFGKSEKLDPYIYAIAEGGNPVKMDPFTMETLGESSLTSLSGESIESFFSAHYKKDPESGDIFNHGMVLGPTPAINVMKLDSSGNLIGQAKTDVPLITFVHDNILSKNYFILFVQQYCTPKTALVEALLGGEPLGKRFEWDSENRKETIAMVFSKQTLEKVAEISLPLFSTYHHLNAVEDPDGSGILKLRTLIHDPPDTRTHLENAFADLYSASQVPACETLIEYTVDVENKNCIGSRIIAHDAAACDLPDMNYAWGFKNRFVYTNSREDKKEWLDTLQKVDLDTGDCSNMVTFGEGVLAGAPIFVPKPNQKTEDDGYIFTQLYRSHDHRSDICILDARTMNKLATLRLEKHVPYQFHGTWYPSAW